MKPSDVLTKEFLEEHYVRQGKGMRTIADEIGLKSKTSVKHALNRYNIPIISDTQRNRRGKPSERKRKGCGKISGSYWCAVRHHAKLRHLALEITIEDAWQIFLAQDGKCALSGVSLVFPEAWDNLSRRAQTASLDRKNSNLGYVHGNIQWVHKDLNWMKREWPESKFLDWCVKVANHHKQGGALS